MGNLPFYLVEHARKPIPLSESAFLFRNAEFEFVDTVHNNTSSDSSKKATLKKERARQCEAKDFANNNSTKAYYESHKDYVMLCPAQDNLYM